MRKIQWQDFSYDDDILGDPDNDHKYNSYQWYTEKDVWIYSATHFLSTNTDTIDIMSVNRSIDKLERFIEKIEDQFYSVKSIVLYVPNSYLFQQQVISRVDPTDVNLIKELNELYALECEAVRLIEIVFAYKCNCSDKKITISYK